MGWDFSALMKYDGPTRDTMRAIDRLESSQEYPPLEPVLEYGREQDYYFARPDANHETPAWLTYPQRDRCTERPTLPTRKACLEIRSDFALMFGADCLWVYHTVRWLQFLTDNGWRKTLLDATQHFYVLFGAADCIITRDEHPSISAFIDGADFRDALATAPDDECAVESLDEMFIDKGVADDLVYAMPDGDYAIPIWDSHGYWRFSPTPNAT